MAYIALTSIRCIIYLAKEKVLTCVMFCWRQRERKLDDFFHQKCPTYLPGGGAGGEGDTQTPIGSELELSFIGSWASIGIDTILVLVSWYLFWLVFLGVSKILADVMV
jgi:hypothetical protein